MTSRVKEQALAASFFLLASGAILLTRLNGGVALLWVANAPLLIFLSRRSPVAWRSALLWATPASIAASTLFGPVAWAAPFLATASIVEVVVAAALLRRWLPKGDFLGSVRSLAVFGGVAGVIAPVTGGVIAATVALLAFPKPWGATFVDWVIGHGLGTMIASPLVLMLVNGNRQQWRRRLSSLLWGRGGLLLAAVATVTAGTFCQQQLPLLFLPALPILLATFKLGRPGAALSIVLVALIGGIATAAGHGPITMTHLSRVGQLQFLQFYLAATFLMSLPLAGELGRRAELLKALKSSEARHRRIVARSQDVIFETDMDGRWTFLSDAWTRITGHGVAESLGRRAMTFVLPQDRQVLVDALVAALRNEGSIGQAELRFPTELGVRWGAFSVGLLHDEAGVLTGAYGTLSDITERKKSQAAILSGERRYRALADNTTDMIARIGLDGRYRSATPAALRLLGIPPEELVGTPFLQLIAPEHLGLALDAFTAVTSGVADPSCSYRQQHRSGEPLWVEATFRLLRDEDGCPREVIASVRDISRRKLLETRTAAALAQVRESNRLFGMAGALASIGHWRFELGTDNIIWSDEVFRIHGLDLGAPPPMADALDLYHPDDRERVRATIGAAVADQRDFRYTARVVQPGGAVRHVIAQGQPEWDDAGIMTGMFGVFQDVTDRALADRTLRDSEARLRLITEQAGDVIALLALDGTCLFMSPASRAILGIPPEDLVGTRPIERTHEQDRPAIERYRAELRSGAGAPGSPLRFRMRRADGEDAWLEASSRLSEIGDMPCVVSVWRDVSPQVAIEAELKAAKAGAEAASMAKAGFLANMSHEIRTPMNGVIGFAELLLAGDLTEEQRRDAGLIADSGRAMMKLLNDILDLSKIDAGQLDVVSEPFDLPHALRACGKLLGPSAVQKRLCFTVTIEDEVPAIVLGDALRVRQIVLNLLGNAIKFTDHGSVALAVRRTEGDGGAWLAITVDDTGIGIAPERQQSIFEEFVQADHSITRRYGGSGLGLAISNRLARLMGGRIELASRPGQGTEVTLLLPCVTAERSAVGAGTMPAGPAGRPGRSARVLLAEDHAVNQLLVRAMLAHGGHQVTVVADGQQALEEVRRSEEAGTPFDLVFMDMQMPVMDGLAATREIRRMERPGEQRLPIVALTANAFAGDLEACRAAGMDDHVAKPVAMEALLGAVDRWSQRAGDGADPVPAAPAGRGRFQPGLAIRARYAEHRANALAEVDALIRRGTFADSEVADVAELLHKLAGSAGMFGEEALGDRASELEQGLLAWPAGERATRVARAAGLLRDAA